MITYQDSKYWIVCYSNKKTLQTIKKGKSLIHINNNLYKNAEEKVVSLLDMLIETQLPLLKSYEISMEVSVTKELFLFFLTSRRKDNDKQEE